MTTIPQKKDGLSVQHTTQHNQFKQCTTSIKINIKNTRAPTKNNRTITTTTKICTAREEFHVQFAY